MNDFQKNELRGRAKFKALLSQKGISDYHFTEEEYAPVDCYFNYNHQCYIAEIKVRNQAYSTLYMEKQKLAKMIQIIKNGEANDGYYANFIGDKVYLFGIRRICQYIKALQERRKRVFFSRQLPQTTSGNTQRIWKEIIELPLQLATCITLNNEADEKDLDDIKK